MYINHYDEAPLVYSILYLPVKGDTDKSPLKLAVKK